MLAPYGAFAWTFPAFFTVLLKLIQFGAINFVVHLVLIPNVRGGWKVSAHSLQLDYLFFILMLSFIQISEMSFFPRCFLGMVANSV